MKIFRAKTPIKTAPDGWADKIIVLWGEDECTRDLPDAETVSKAWDRIFCGPIGNVGSWKFRGDMVATVDHGDWNATLYAQGGILISSIDGYEIGILADARLDAPASQAEPVEPVFTLSDVETACRNIGYDSSCGACASFFFTGASFEEHTCPGPQSMPSIPDEDRKFFLPLQDVPHLPPLLPGAPICTLTPGSSSLALDVREPTEGRRDGGADLAQALGRLCGLDASRPIQWVLNGSASRSTLVLSDRYGRTSAWTSQEGFSSPCVPKLGDVDLVGPHADRLALIVLAKRLMGVVS